MGQWKTFEWRESNARFVTSGYSVTFMGKQYILSLARIEPTIEHVRRVENGKPLKGSLFIDKDES